MKKCMLIIHKISKYRPEKPELTQRNLCALQLSTAISKISKPDLVKTAYFVHVTGECENSLHCFPLE